MSTTSQAQLPQHATWVALEYARNYSATNDAMIGNFVHDIGLVNSAQCPGYVTVHGLYHANPQDKLSTTW